MDVGKGKERDNVGTKKTPRTLHDVEIRTPMNSNEQDEREPLCLSSSRKPLRLVKKKTSLSL